MSPMRYAFRERDPTGGKTWRISLGAGSARKSRGEEKLSRLRNLACLSAGLVGLALALGAAPATALASEASGQRGHFISARAGHSPELGSSARAAQSWLDSTLL